MLEPRTVLHGRCDEEEIRQKVLSCEEASEAYRSHKHHQRREIDTDTMHNKADTT